MRYATVHNAPVDEANVQYGDIIIKDGHRYLWAQIYRSFPRPMIRFDDHLPKVFDPFIENINLWQWEGSTVWTSTDMEFYANLSPWIEEIAWRAREIWEGMFGSVFVHPRMGEIIVFYGKDPGARRRYRIHEESYRRNVKVIVMK